MSRRSYFDPLQYSIEQLSISELYHNSKPALSKAYRKNSSYFLVSCKFGAVGARPKRTALVPNHGSCIPNCIGQQSTIRARERLRDVLRPRRAHVANSSSNALASFRSSV